MSDDPQTTNDKKNVTRSDQPQLRAGEADPRGDDRGRICPQDGKTCLGPCDVSYCAEAAERSLSRPQRILDIFRSAAADEQGLTDGQFRLMVRILNFNSPSTDDEKRTHDLAAKYGWENHQQRTPIEPLTVGVTDEHAAEIMDAFAALRCAMTHEQESESISRVIAAVRADERLKIPAWQSIETAPKDGTRILVTVKGMADSTSLVCGNYAREQFTSWDGSRFGYTHWMALPLPPSEEK